MELWYFAATRVSDRNCYVQFFKNSYLFDANFLMGNMIETYLDFPAFKLSKYLHNIINGELISLRLMDALCKKIKL